ncbi:hypothetical protein V8E36_003917 [Tilletia maclaganii]
MLPDPASSISAPSGQVIANVVPAGFEYDGRLDVLPMTQAKSRSSSTDEFRHGLYLGQASGGFAQKPIESPFHRPHYISSSCR